MAYISMRSGLKLSIPTALTSLSFVQRGNPFLPKGYTGKDASLAKKTTNIFTGESKHASGGRVQLFSGAATASVKGPEKPPINKGVNRSRLQMKQGRIQSLISMKKQKRKKSSTGKKMFA